MLISRSLLKDVTKYTIDQSGTIIYLHHKPEHGERAVIGASYLIDTSLKQINKTIAKMDSSLLYQLRQTKEVEAALNGMVRSIKEGMR